MPSSGLPHVTPEAALTPEVLRMLEDATGLGDRDSWLGIWFLISKAEQDNEKVSGTFEIESSKGSLFGYASALSYDMKQRGVTIGLVGWTTGNDHKDGAGDAPELFKIYKSLGGDDLMPYVKGCCGSKEKCDVLIRKIHSIATDPKWIAAQWKQLVTNSPDGAYIFHTMAAFKKIGIAKPSALALSVVLDTSLNQGHDGPDGGCSHLIKLATKGNEIKTLEAYIAWKSKVAGTNEYNDPPSNGKARAKMFGDLLKAKCFDLKSQSALKAAVGWTMK